MSLTHIIKSFKRAADVRQIKTLLSKHFLKHLMKSSLTQRPRQSQPPDECWRQPSLSKPHSESGPAEAFRHCVSTNGRPQIDEWQFRHLHKSCLLLYISVFAETQQREQACQATVHEGAPEPVKHQGAGWMNTIWPKASSTNAASHQSPSTGPEESVCHQWLSLKIVLQ